jgi:hypothetical protein
MKLNSTKAREVEKDLLSFYTNAIAYLMKWSTSVMKTTLNTLNVSVCHVI